MDNRLSDWLQREGGRSSSPQRLLHEGLTRSTLRAPEKVALVIEGKSYSYRELLTTAGRLGTQLIKHGVKRGDRVAVYMDNTWPCISALYAILMAGGVFLLINPQTKSEKLRFILQDSGAVALFTDAHLSGQFTPVLQTLPALSFVVISGTRFQGQPGMPLITQFDELADTDHGIPPQAGCIPNDLAALIYTSGSTGHPKGVMQTHQAMTFTTWSLLEYLRLAEHDNVLLVLPLAFDYGLYQLLMTITLGATLVVERSFTYPGQIYHRMREENVTVFPGVPTIFSTMIAGHKKKKMCFPAVQKITNTAARLPVEYISDLKEIFPQAQIYKMYGLTECKRVSYLEPDLLDVKPGSVGKAIPGTEVFLRTPEGKPVSNGNDGILYVRGPHVMAGYWNQPQLSEKMLKPGFLPGERVLCTGDWFTMDEEGFLYFSGRSDDIIKTRGEKVSPVEVENVLHGIAGVQEAVVIGVDDDLLGQAVVAYVVLYENTSLAANDVRKLCAVRLENYMIPKEVIILNQMPKMSNDKIDRKALAARNGA